MNLVPVLLTGLLAGGVSCAAVQGSLLAGLVSRQRTPAPSPVGRPAAPPAAKSVLGSRLGDDLVPAAGFLTGKIVSHTVLGALLGALGEAVALSLHLRTIAQLAAGVLIILLGLAQLGVRALRGFVIEPPASWTRFVRGRARSQSVFAPLVLGLATILIPCGVTLSVMALAMTSGSAWAGAATMAVFVIGTGPLFTVLGYAAARARRAGGLWQRRLAIATGLAVLASGLYTVNGGLEVSGSPLAASQLAQALGMGPAPVSTSVVGPDAPPVSVTDGHQTVVVTARTERYSPANIEIVAGLPTTLVVRSDDARGCVRYFVIPKLGKQLTLPVNGDTAIDLGTLTPGRLRYSCGMGMYTGQLTIVEKTS